MKKIISLAFLFGLLGSIFAQNIHVFENTYQKVAISFASDSLLIEDITTDGGVFSLISMPGYGFSNNPGAPQLPQMAKLLQIPVCDSVIVNVVNAEYEEYAAADLGIHHPLWPSQPSVSKSATNPPFAYDQTIYATDAFYSLPSVSVEKGGIRRDIAFANIYFSPVQCNPVTQRIRICTRLDVEFTFANPDLVMTNGLRKYASPMFSLDTALVVNKMKNAAKNEYTGVPIKYLIIVNSIFSSNTKLEEFVAWKRRLGYLVEVAYTGTAGVGTTTTSIKSFIQEKYDNATSADPAPSFLLLIGDVAQLPAFTGQSSSSHVTDLYYATLAGNDNIPDCYYGRLSATNSTHLTNQLEKIMMYESYTMPDPSYLGKAVLIAGTDGNGYSPTHANGQINYIYNNYINTTSATHTFTTVYEHLYNCSSQAATIRSEIGAGVGIANYTAHGSSSGWADPAFSTSHISSMSNANKYGLMIGNCCLSGKFDDSECFGEALLRAANKGAMGYIGASNSSYWNEDVYWAVGVRSSIVANMSYDASHLGTFDKMFHTHGEAYTNWMSTIGGMIQGGNLSVQSSSSSRKQYYWEIYHCFGDPSVRVFLGMPSTMTVTADATLTPETTNYTVQAAPYAYVALKKDTTTFVAAAFANALGIATLPLPSSLEMGNYELVALAQNYIPYFQDVEVVDDGACASPSGLAVSNVTPFTATVSWTGSGDSYNIQRRDSSTDWVTVATGVTATSYTFTGLQDNTAYQVRVQSVCGNETSYWKIISFTTPEACPTPTGLSCGLVTASTATLSWTENGTATLWTLQYGTDSTFTPGTYTEVAVSGTPANALSGLTAEIPHYARVKAYCGGDYGESQWSGVCAFLPSAVVTIGAGDATSNYLPTNNYYKYSLTQQIYTVAELGDAGAIQSIGFYKNSTTSCNRNLDIYMVSTTKSGFSGGSDWIQVTNANKVFSGTVNFASNDWTTITLDTPFSYDGQQNVAVIVDDNTGSYVSNTPFLVFNATSQAIRIYSDGTNYNATAPSSYSGSVMNTKNQVRFLKNTVSFCTVPENVAVGDITYSSATVSWSGAADAYNVRYRMPATTTDNDNWLVLSGATSPFTLTGLCGNTFYEVEVQADCGVDGTSDWTTAMGFTTDACSGTPIHTSTAVTGCGSYTWTSGNGQTYTATGDYTYEHPDANGCTQVDTLHLTINQPVSSEISFETSDSCYLWNGQSYCASGDYVQTLTAANGCDSVVTLHLTTSVGVESHDFTVTMTVYPNPASEIVNILCTIYNGEVETMRILLYDANGKLVDVVETRHGTSLQTQIDLSGLSSGIYFVKTFADGNVVAVRKVVKQ